MKIFISYSSKDKPFVLRLATALNKEKINVWFDQWEIKVGDSIIEKINEAFDEISGIIVVLSENSIKSNWVRKELSAGLMMRLSDKKIGFYPIVVDNCKIPPIIIDYKYADFRDDFSAGLDSVVSSLTGKNSTKSISNSAKNPESSINYYSQMGIECRKAFERLNYELILLADIILEAWFHFSQDEKGNKATYFPYNKLSKVADYIIDRVIVDSRADSIENIEMLRNSSMVSRAVLVNQITHFDRDVFLSTSKDYYDSTSSVFTTIIPSQFIGAYEKFINQWTYDVRFQNREIIFRYLQANAKYINLPENLDQLGHSDYFETEIDLKILVILERIGFLSSIIFSRGWIGKVSSPYFSAALERVYFKSIQL